MKTTVALLLLSLPAHAGIAFLQDQRVSGMNRICVYSYMGSEYTMTIKSYKVCPVTVEIPS